MGYLGKSSFHFPIPLASFIVYQLTWLQCYLQVEEGTGLSK
jgi:hypothetical protein